MEPRIIDWTAGKPHVSEDNSFPKLDEMLKRKEKQLPKKLWIHPFPWPDPTHIVFAVGVGIVGASLFVAGVAYKIYLVFFA